MVSAFVFSIDAENLHSCICETIRRRVYGSESSGISVLLSFTMIWNYETLKIGIYSGFQYVILRGFF
jgi:hypothetical protein